MCIENAFGYPASTPRVAPGSVGGVAHTRSRRAAARALTVEEGGILKTSPWHSIKQSVHHDNTSCNTGNNIESENRRSGTGGKPKCDECARL